MPRTDISGRDRIVWNVVASWVGHLIFVIAGFILPYFIDRNIGQTALGVWDFCWSVVGYFGLVQLGVGSSVIRYVAKYRAEDDWTGLNRMLSSALHIQVVVMTVVVVLTVVATWSIPGFLSSRLGAFVSEARWVVCLLGISLAIRIVCNPFGGVITGCHRWDLHNGINAGFHGLTVIAMIVMVWRGGALRSLAVVNLVGAILAEVTRIVVAYRVCPNLQLHWRYARWSEARNLLAFGGKSVLSTLSHLLTYQTNSMLVVSHLGAGALALYSRPIGLVRQVGTMVDKFSFVLTPTSSSMQAGGQLEELRRFLVDAGRSSAYMALPPVLFLTIFGGPLLRIWMGPRYELGGVLAILAIGSLMTVTQQPAWSILTGMNAHGRPAAVQLAGALLSVGLGALALGPWQMGLAGAALAISLPTSIVDGVYLPIYASRQCGLTVRVYLARIWVDPLLCAVPFAACLVVGRLFSTSESNLGVLFTAAVGGPVLLATYWHRVLPSRVPEGIKRVIGNSSRRLGWLAASTNSRGKR